MLLSSSIHFVELHIAGLLRIRKATRSTQDLRDYRTSWLHVANYRCSPTTRISCTCCVRLCSTKEFLVISCTKLNVELYDWLNSTSPWVTFPENGTLGPTSSPAGLLPGMLSFLLDASALSVFLSSRKTYRSCHRWKL